MDSLYIVIPAYNEEKNLEKVVREWYHLLDGKADQSRLVVADSGSSDKTHSILQKLQTQLPRLEILDNTLKQHGPKLIALYDHAIKNNADFIFQTDSDGQTNPKEFDAFWKVRSKYSAVMGYRPVRGDGKSRAVVENIVCLLLRLIFGVKVPDANAPFRLMRTDIVSKYLHRLNSNYSLTNIMLTTYFVFYNENITFRSISFKPRQGGINSINLFKIIRIGWTSLWQFFRFKRDMV
ncbi:MAG: glycosyltransferase family 2 protein [Lachnospiraceae bacterium]|nr:glycosyltransferase family 2 protein [Lachnospiraceae bacterium]